MVVVWASYCPGGVLPGVLLFKNESCLWERVSVGGARILSRALSARVEEFFSERSKNSCVCVCCVFQREKEEFLCTSVERSKNSRSCVEPFSEGSKNS